MAAASWEIAPFDVSEIVPSEPAETGEAILIALPFEIEIGPFEAEMPPGEVPSPSTSATAVFTSVIPPRDEAFVAMNVATMLFAELSNRFAVPLAGAKMFAVNVEATTLPTPDCVRLPLVVSVTGPLPLVLMPSVPTPRETSSKSV